MDIQAICPSKAVDSSDIFDLESAPYLNPEESYAFSFVISKRFDENAPDEVTKKVLFFDYKTIGIPVVTWYTGMGECGVFRGSELLTPSTQAHISTNANVNSNTGRNNINATSENESPIKLMCVQAPASVCLGDEFEVIIRVINMSSLTMSAALCNKPNNSKHKITDDDSSNVVIDHLCVVGLSFMKLGELEGTSYRDIPLRFMALASGLQECRELCVTDTTTSIDYFSGCLFKVLVTDEEQESEAAP